MINEQEILQKTLNVLNILIAHGADENPSDNKRLMLDSFFSMVDTINLESQDFLYPYYIAKEGEGMQALDALMISNIKKIAIDSGYANGFVEVQLGSEGLLFFNRFSLAFITEILKNTGYTVVNIGANGIVLRNFNLIGLYTLEEERAKAAIKQLMELDGKF